MYWISNMVQVGEKYLFISHTTNSAFERFLNGQMLKE